MFPTTGAGVTPDSLQLFLQTHLIPETKDYGFRQCLNASLEPVKALATELQSRYTTLIVVGIGGSDLGGRTLIEALGQKQSHPVWFVGDTTDPTSANLLNQLDPTNTCVCIISKSGETVEPTAWFALLWQWFSDKGVTNIADHFVCITDPKQGMLRQLATTQHLHTLDMPTEVGGRFSVLTSVGLFPAAWNGIDIESLVEGAREISDLQIPFEYAALLFLHLEQQRDITVLMPYSQKLREFARWFRQLWAESLGKDGKSLTPISAMGPADQHSQLQLYAEGPDDKTITFIEIEQQPDITLPAAIPFPTLQYLQSKSLLNILKLERKATALSLFHKHRPNATITLAEINARELGKLFLFFELVVVYVASLLQIDAFNQPGVEDSKQMIATALGKTSLNGSSLPADWDATDPTIEQI